MHELVLELEKMSLLAHLDDGYVANSNTTEFLRYFENDQWDKIHEYFLPNYQFYRDFIHILQAHINDCKGLALNEIREESVNRKLSLTRQLWRSFLAGAKGWASFSGVSLPGVFT